MAKFPNFLRLLRLSGVEEAEEEGNAAVVQTQTFRTNSNKFRKKSNKMFIFFFKNTKIFARAIKNIIKSQKVEIFQKIASGADFRINIISPLACDYIEVMRVVGSYIHYFLENVKVRGALVRIWCVTAR